MGLPHNSQAFSESCLCEVPNQNMSPGDTNLSPTYGISSSCFKTPATTTQSHLCSQVNFPDPKPFFMPWWKQKRPLTNALTLKHNGHTWANLRYHWWVYLNCSNINKNSGDRYWGKNLKDPKSSRGMISRSCLSTLSRSKRPREISKSLPTTSCVPLYPAPWVLHTSMVNFSQLVADSTLWFKLNFISSLGVSVQTNIPQHMTDCKVCHSLLYISSPTNGMIQFDFRYKNEKECILGPRKSSFLNSTVQVQPDTRTV